MILSLALFLCVSSSDAYRAAVVTAMYNGSHYNSTILDVFAPLIAKAAAAGAQIVVTPEAMIWDDNTHKQAVQTADEVPEIGANPCLNPSVNASKLYLLSCLARKNHIVLVFNVLDRIPCTPPAPPPPTPCPSDGYLVYNTHVAFDEEGALLAKYYKRHDYPPLDQPPLGVVSFNTSFGVEFGMLICYDMAFMTPSYPLGERGVRNIVFSTFWRNEAPMQTATLIQQGYSRWYGANLIASNAVDGLMYSGSGIYSAGEVIQAIYNATGPWPAGPILIVADLPEKPAYPPVTEEAKLSLPLTPPAGSTVLADSELCTWLTGDEDECGLGSDAGYGACTFMPQGSKDELHLSAVNGTVKCDLTLKLSSPSQDDYVLFASDWRVDEPQRLNWDAPLDICSLMQCRGAKRKKEWLYCEHNYNVPSHLHVESFQLTLTSPTLTVIYPAVGVNNAENLRQRTDINFSWYPDSHTAVLATSELSAPLYLATLWGIDSEPPRIENKIPRHPRRG